MWRVASLFLWFFVLALAGCEKAATAPSTVKILALGDSYTIGESVEKEERWPVQLAERLTREGVRAEAPKIVARTGWTSTELLEALDGDVPGNDFDVVLVLIGVNDQFQGRSAEMFRIELVKVLARAKGYAGGRAGRGGRVVVLSIPDWGVTRAGRDFGRAGVAGEIDLFNRVCEEEARAAGMPFVDVTELSRRGRDDEALQAEDGLHPSGRQYGQWVERVLPVVKGVLEKR